jgi:cytochrome c-type biogenesis protein CcsB
MSMSVAVQVPVPRAVGSFATASATAALAFLTLSIAVRAIATERPPLGNLWEYTVALGWGITLFTVAFEVAFRERAVSAVMMTVAATMMGVALVFFPSEITPLVPALQSNRILGVHVSSMLLAYSALSVSFGAAVLFLLQGQERRFARLPAAETLEDIGYWSVLVGFPLLTLGIALGAYWANSAWGRYWGWDPKETAALLTWFVYAGYLHARVLRGWEGKRSAYLLIAGFGAVMFTYFAVNFLISGLHSYAGV